MYNYESIAGMWWFLCTLVVKLTSFSLPHSKGSEGCWQQVVRQLVLLGIYSSPFVDTISMQVVFRDRGSLVKQGPLRTRRQVPLTGAPLQGSVL